MCQTPPPSSPALAFPSLPYRTSSLQGGVLPMPELGPRSLQVTRWTQLSAPSAQANFSCAKAWFHRPRHLEVVRSTGCDDITLEPHSFEWGRILIEMSHLERIEESVEVTINGLSFRVHVSEVESLNEQHLYSKCEASCYPRGQAMMKSRSRIKRKLFL
ncbi:hypothetical protein V6N13_048214 [Hibiscus sabdariffa]